MNESSALIKGEWPAQLLAARASGLFAADLSDDLQDHPKPDNPNHQRGNRRKDGCGRGRDGGGIGKRRLREGRFGSERSSRNHSGYLLDFI